MFCHKCGAQIADDAAFCHKCGAKMGNTDTTPQIPNIPARTSEPREATQPQTHNVPSDMPKKKKYRKLPIIIGAVALAIVAVIVIAMNWNGKIDYEATVRAHQPFVSQGTSLTYGEVLDKYISSPDWKVRKSGDVNYVDISGKAKGTDNELVVTIKVTEDPSDPDLAKIAPESVTIDGKKSPTKNDAVEFLLAMFFAYDEGYKDLSKLLSGTELAEAQGEVSLTETYTNDTAGIAFNYPTGWVILNPDNEFEVVEMIDSQKNADSIASFKVFNIFNQDPFGVFTGDEASVRKAVNENATFLEFGDTLLGDVPAKGLKYRTTGLKGDDIVANFWYVIENNVYQITCSYSASTSDIYEPIFKAIMESYTITDANTSGENGSEVTYYVEFSESYSEGYEPTVVLYQDGRFDFYANMAEGINVYSGTYTPYEESYIFRVAETEYHVDFEFSMRFSDDTLIYEGLDPLGMTNYGAVFSLSATPPKSIMDGNDEYADIPATTTSEISTRDFIGEFSYDASFEDPTGGWNNFYYLLEIGMGGSDLVVTTSWRGMYMFDHVRVSPDSLTGNTLVFDAITNDSTEPQSHSLTYIPAKDSPLGKDTIYIDGDETMPYVRE